MAKASASAREETTWIPGYDVPPVVVRTLYKVPCALCCSLECEAPRARTSARGRQARTPQIVLAPMPSPGARNYTIWVPGSPSDVNTPYRRAQFHAASEAGRMRRTVLTCRHIAQGVSVVVISVSIIAIPYAAAHFAKSL